MKRIGIVTLYYKNYNYGGQLQAYAMQKLFESAGYQAELITFEIKHSSYMFQRFRDLGVKKSIISFCSKYKFKALMKNVEFKKSIALKMRRFENFMNDIPHTRLYSANDISELNNKFDIFVCGSDQIWNPGWWNDILFLCFSDKPKFSYAASIAREKLSEEEVYYLKQRTADYIGISVREKQAQILLSNILDRKIEVSLDPTLMVDISTWIKILKRPYTKEKYVLFYMVGNSKGLKQKVYKECKKRGYSVYSIGFSKNTYYKSDVEYSDYVIKDAGPREWLGWIANATYVFTDSFHGSVFSILFERNFWCFERDNPKDSLNENSRLYNFLTLTGLGDRLLEYNTKLNITENSIDFVKVKERLLTYRQQSNQYIKNCLKKAEDNAGKKISN